MGLRVGTVRRAAAGLLVAALVANVLFGAPDAPAAPTQFRVAMSDGVELAAHLSGDGIARPTLVEFSPYGDAAAIPAVSADYNYLEVHIRGTGHSDGAFDALGPRSQQDVTELLDWACQQPWSNGRLGLWGFSASAIMAYNSMHQELPCVEAAVLGAGTHELYRDLMYPGGVPNAIPALVVLLAIGGSSLAAGPARLEREPASSLVTLQGMFDTGFSYLEHPTLDGWWQERGMRGNVNDFPILMITGFFDVESRGPFQVFQELQARGPHPHQLLVIGAHDGVPAGTGGADADRLRWYDRYLRDVDNGVDQQPPVRLWMADGDREDLLAGHYVRADGEAWPVPGTEWTTFHLDGSALRPAPGAVATRAFVPVPSLPTATDPHTIATVGVFNDAPLLTDMTLAEPVGLSFTSDPFAEDVHAAGPAAVELALTTTTPTSDVLAVLSDVWPDGTAHPVATGRLRTSYPDIDLDRSLVDGDGTVVQPYGVYDRAQPALPGVERRYHVELWPIGNRFRAGHRLRLHLLGPSALSVPGLPAVHVVRLGDPDGSQLHLPVLPAGAVVGP